MRLRPSFRFILALTSSLAGALVACGSDDGAPLLAAAPPTSPDPDRDEDENEEPSHDEDGATGAGDAGRWSNDTGGSSNDTGGSSNDAAPPAKDGSATTDAGAPGKRVFLTSTEYRGDLRGAANAATGTAGADALCNLVAQAEGLSGQWTAWLSDSTTNAIDRIVGDGPWHRMDGQLAFANRANLQTGARVPISIDEKGQSWTNQRIHGTWTGTAQTGVKTAARCNDWTSSAMAVQGTVGDLTSAKRWSADALDVCSYPHHLYCFEN
jgi:hypothetical protein